MHIPDHVMDPSTEFVTVAIATAGIGYAAYRVSRELPPNRFRLLGVVAACVFAAQMLNFPVSSGMSGHLIGAVLAAIILGPWAGMLAVSAVLVVQCVLFQDGGITAFGANVINMAMVGSLIGYAVYDRVRTRIGGKIGSIIGAVAASWVSVFLGGRCVVCSSQRRATFHWVRH